MLLSRGELEELLDKPNIMPSGKQIQATCPSCGEREFYVSLLKEDHPGQCWRKNKCGYTCNVYSLAKLAGRYEEIIGERKEGFFSSKLTACLEKPIYENTLEEIEFETVEMPAKYSRIYHHPYLEGRGFTSEEYEYHEVGKSETFLLKNKYVYFPVVQLGKRVAYVGRAIVDGIKKYNNSESRFEYLFYGLEKLYKPQIVVLVEGILDKVAGDKAMRELGIGKDEVLFLSLFGSSINPWRIEFIKKMLNPKTVVVMLDEDALKSALKYGQQMAYTFESVMVSILGKNEDPWTLGTQGIAESLCESPNIFSLNHYLTEALV